MSVTVCPFLDGTTHGGKAIGLAIGPTGRPAAAGRPRYRSRAAAGPGRCLGGNLPFVDLGLLLIHRTAQPADRFGTRVRPHRVVLEQPGLALPLVLLVLAAAHATHAAH